MAARATSCLWLDAGPLQELLAEVPPLRAALLEQGDHSLSPVAAGFDQKPAVEQRQVSGENLPPREETPPLRRGWFRKYPWVPQHDETDCGAAALAMVARAYGVRLSVGRLRETANVGREGASMLSLALAAESVGFNARAVRTDSSHLAGLPLPAIAHYKGGLHYVVLYEVNNDKVVIGDPALGVVSVSRAEFEQGWTGRLLLLTATPRLHGEEEQRALCSASCPS